MQYDGSRCPEALGARVGVRGMVHDVYRTLDEMRGSGNEDGGQEQAAEVWGCARGSIHRERTARDVGTGYTWLLATNLSESPLLLSTAYNVFATSISICMIRKGYTRRQPSLQINSLADFGRKNLNSRFNAYMVICLLSLIYRPSTDCYPSTRYYDSTP